MIYSKNIPVQWSDVDANGHMRNTAFSEFCTHVRFSFFAEEGFDMEKLKELQVGPVILREELIYLREVKLLEITKVTCELLRSTHHHQKFTFLQKVFKENGKLAAKITLDALWMDLVKRKPIIPPPPILEICEKLPKSNNYKVVDDTFFREMLR